MLHFMKMWKVYQLIIFVKYSYTTCSTWYIKIMLNVCWWKQVNVLLSVVLSYSRYNSTVKGKMVKRSTSYLSGKNILCISQKVIIIISNLYSAISWFYRQAPGTFTKNMFCKQIYLHAFMLGGRRYCRLTLITKLKPDLFIVNLY